MKFNITFLKVRSFHRNETEINCWVNLGSLLTNTMLNGSIGDIF